MKRFMMQGYVRNSLKAVSSYQEAFDAKIISQYKNDDGTYLHVELEIAGQVLALSEASKQTIPGTTMQFCFQYMPDQVEALEKAYEILSLGGDIIHPLGPSFYSPLMADFIDGFGLRWCLFI